MPDHDLHVRVEPRPFAAAVAWAAKHIPTRPVLPILGSLLLDVTAGQVTVCGYDFDVAARADVDAVGDGARRLLVSGRMLADLARTLPDKPVDLVAGSAHLTLRCGPVKVTMPLIPDVDYPHLPEVPTTAGVVPAAEFATAMVRAGIAADLAGDRGLDWLRGIRINLRPDNIEVWATDRYRAAIARIGWKSAGGHADQAVLPPAAHLIKAAKAFHSTDEDLLVGVTGGRLLGLSVAGRSLVIGTQVNNFPDHYPDLFPARSDTPARVAVADLLIALERANIVCGAKTIAAHLSFTAEGLGVHSHHNETAAEAYELVDCAYTGPDVAVGVNPTYFTDALTGLRSDTVEISVAAPNKPVLLTAADDPDQAYRHLVVPIVNR